MAIISKFAGMFDAWAYAYGVNDDAPAPLQVLSGSTASGTYTLTCQNATSSSPNGVKTAPTTATPITVGFGTNAETVTPSGVSTDNLGNILITATFANAHSTGEQVRSGTYGLQEALLAASAYGGGTVILSAAWAKGGGTEAIINAATDEPNVNVQDNRTGGEQTSITVTLTNAQVLGMEVTPVELLPAPGTASLYDITKATLVNLNTGVAYANGGAITIGYGATAATNALSGTIAATFLTSPTATEVITVAGGVTAATAGTSLLNEPIYITNATAPFITGTGTLQIKLEYTTIDT